MNYFVGWGRRRLVCAASLPFECVRDRALRDCAHAFRQVTLYVDSQLSTVCMYVHTLYAQTNHQYMHVYNALWITNYTCLRARARVCVCVCMCGYVIHMHMHVYACCDVVYV